MAGVEVEEISLRLLSTRDVILTATTSAVTLLVLIYWWRSRSASKNPFQDDFVRAPCSVELDRKKRSKVLKQRFSPERVPKDLDAIVIGSGMGGLVCAGCLSRAGKRVLVLEQHDRAGGSTHTFKEKGFEFDVGLHYMGKMDVGSMNHTLLDVMSDGQLVWDELDEEFDTVILRQKDGSHKSFTYKAGKNEYEKRLMEYFPDEKEAITEFMKILNRSEKAVVGYTMMKTLPTWIVKFLAKTGIYSFLFSRYRSMVTTSVKDTLDKLTTNEELKVVLSYAFGDYGTFPSEAPILIHGILMKHFYDGGFYPRGGSSELAFHMIPGIERGGGAVLVKAPVARILFDNGRAVGVSVTRSSKEHEIYAPIIVTSAGLFNTYCNLVPKQISSNLALENICKKVDTGPACFQILVGLNGSTEDLRLPKKNFWIYGGVDPERSIKEFLALSREDAVTADIPLAFVSFPSAKDSTWKLRHPGKSVCVVVTFLKWEWFEEWEDERINKRGPVYDDLKKAFQDQVWKTVLEITPQLKDKVEYIDSGTPLSHKHYLGCPKGDIYGVNHTMKRFQYEIGMELRPKTKIKGLYMTGQDSFTCGVMGAALSGMMTSGVILGRNHFVDLFRLMGIRKVRRTLVKC